MYKISYCIAPYHTLLKRTERARRRKKSRTVGLTAGVVHSACCLLKIWRENNSFVNFSYLPATRLA